jgi:hypothetical protein
MFVRWDSHLGLRAPVARSTPGYNLPALQAGMLRNESPIRSATMRALKERPTETEDHHMSAERPATKGWFRLQFSLASLVFMSVMAGVLFFVNFQKNENWHLAYDILHGDKGPPLSQREPFLQTTPSVGYGWPYFVTNAPGDPGPSEWSWMGLCGNIVIGGVVLSLLSALFEMGWRWKRKGYFRFTRRDWIVLTACVIALLALSWRPRNIHASLEGTSLVEVYSGRGWPWHWYSERIAHGVPPNSESVANLPVHTGFSSGRFNGTGFVLDLFAGILICGLLARFLIRFRRNRKFSTPQTPTDSVR